MRSPPSTLAPSGERFPRHCRLTRAADIRRVQLTGQRRRTPWFDVRVAAAIGAHARVAVVVPRYQQSAVSRNRVKRRLRELVRRELLPGLAPQDIVVRATPAAYRASFDGLRDAMQKVSAQLATPV